MHAVRGVDLQAWLSFFLHHFIDGGGTKILAGISVLGDAFRRALRPLGRVRPDGDRRGLSGGERARGERAHRGGSRKPDRRGLAHLSGP